MLNAIKRLFEKKEILSPCDRRIHEEIVELRKDNAWLNTHIDQITKAFNKNAARLQFCQDLVERQCEKKTSKFEKRARGHNSTGKQEKAKRQ